MQQIPVNGSRGSQAATQPSTAEEDHIEAASINLAIQILFPGSRKACPTVNCVRPSYRDGNVRDAERKVDDK